MDTDRFLVFFILVICIEGVLSATTFSLNDGHVTSTNTDFTIKITPSVGIVQNATVTYNGMNMAHVAIVADAVTMTSSVPSVRFEVSEVRNEVTLKVLDISISDNNAKVSYVSNRFGESAEYVLTVKYQNCSADLTTRHAVYTIVPPRGLCCSIATYYLHGCETRFTCNASYNANDLPVIRTCVDGKWSNDLPDCEQNCPADANDIQIVSKTVLPSGDGCTHNKYNLHGCLTYFECANGYHSSDLPSKRLCTNGVWSGALPNCLPNCHDIVTPNHQLETFSQCTLSSYNWHSCVTKFSCIDGYHGNGLPVTLECSNGSWSETLPSCSKNCPADETSSKIVKMDEEPKGYLCTPSSYYLHGCTTKFICATGYNGPNTPVKRTCRDGHWDALLPDCQANCKKDQISPQILLPATTPTGDSCTIENYNLHGCATYFTCSPGYNAADSPALRVCDNGTWVGELPDCHEDCSNLLPTLVELSNETLPMGAGCTQTSFNKHGCSSTFVCMEGYNAENSPRTSFCNKGLWVGGFPQCKRNCDKTLQPFHTVVQSDKTNSFGCTYTQYNLHGCTTTFSCIDGSTAINSPVARTCVDGNWNVDLPDCQTDCSRNFTDLHVISKVMGPANTGCSVSNYNTHGCRVTFTCVSGYSLRGGSHTRTCSKGNWSSTLPNCIKVCPILTNNVIVDETVDVLGDDCDAVNYNFEGCTTAFTCANGFHETGLPRTRTCTNGTWSAEDIICERNCNQVDSGYTITSVEGSGCSREKYYLHGCTTEFTCSQNFTVDGNSSVSSRCDNGVWLKSLPTCDKPETIPTEQSNAGLSVAFLIFGLILGCVILIVVYVVLVKFRNFSMEKFEAIIKQEEAKVDPNKLEEETRNDIPLEEGSAAPKAAEQNMDEKSEVTVKDVKETKEAPTKTSDATLGDVQEKKKDLNTNTAEEVVESKTADSNENPKEETNKTSRESIKDEEPKPIKASSKQLSDDPKESRNKTHGGAKKTKHESRSSKTPNIDSPATDRRKEERSSSRAKSTSRSKESSRSRSASRTPGSIQTRTRKTSRPRTPPSSEEILNVQAIALAASMASQSASKSRKLNAETRTETK